MRSYETARAVFSFLGFMFWAGVVLGVLVAIVGLGAAGSNFGRGPGILAAMPGIFIAVISLLGVAIVQNARAGVDTAELTQQALAVARDQLQVSKQALRQGETLQASFAALKAEQTPAANWDGLKSTPEQALPKGTSAVAPDAPVFQPNGDMHYRGKIVRKGMDGYLYNGKVFSSPEPVKQAIDDILQYAPPVLKAER